jgi:hypothetical protein
MRSQAVIRKPAIGKLTVFQGKYGISLFQPIPLLFLYIHKPDQAVASTSLLAGLCAVESNHLPVIDGFFLTTPSGPDQHAHRAAQNPVLPM